MIPKEAVTWSEVAILNKYFITLKETDIHDEISNTSNIELTTTDGKYKINLSKIYKGSFLDSTRQIEQLADGSE